MADKFRQGFQFLFVVQPAKHDHRNRAERNDGQFNRATIQSVRNQMCLAGNIHPEFERNCAGRERQQNAGEHGEAAGERHGRVVDFALAGVIHEIDAQAPFAPERQREQRRQKRARQSGEKKIERKGHERRPWSAANFR